MAVAVQIKSGDWPEEPGLNLFAQKGRNDGGSQSAGGPGLRTAQMLIREVAKFDLGSYSGPKGPIAVAQTPEQRRVVRRARLRTAFVMTAIVLGGLLGVAITERAFFIFGLTPFQTILLTAGVELLIILGGHQSGDRFRSWKGLTRGAQVIAVVLLFTTIFTVVSVAVVRALILGQVEPQVSPAIQISMMVGLGMLLAVLAIDAGFRLREGEDNPAGLQDRGYKMSATERRQMLETRRDKWMACQLAYMQAYREVAAPETSVELEHIEPLEIPIPPNPWADRTGDPSPPGSHSIE